jgi:hypothetical protein
VSESASLCAEFVGSGVRDPCANERARAGVQWHDVSVKNLLIVGAAEITKVVGAAVQPSHG